jgi:hypothetical protein
VHLLREQPERVWLRQPLQRRERARRWRVSRPLLLLSGSAVLIALCCYLQDLQRAVDDGVDLRTD